ncbi:MAG: L-rhamnonate dehydratase [Actinomycetota bacterium]|nr:L-rhamnonate dehydratase [Actinomycetota bacterium]
MRITTVTAVPFGATGRRVEPSWLTSTVIANPMSIYPRYAAARSSWSAGFAKVLVEITTNDGLSGIGTAFGGAASAALINEHFARLLVGEKAGDIERLWDECYRASLPYGRAGLPVMALSGVDHALWDLAGKAAQKPVYALLGGACRVDLPIYQTTNDREDWASPEGFGIKLAMAYGPADGVEGLRKNAELVTRCREVIGEDRDLMLDCYMAFDVEYTRRLIDLVAPAKVRWIEEPLAPDDYRGYEALGRRDSPVTIASGEHEFTRWGFVRLIETGGVQVLQPDVEWVGGISEARRICTLASCYHLMVVPHGGALQAGALHLMKSQVNTPIAEWVRTYDRATVRPGAAIEGIPEPTDGRIAPSEAPGLGISRGAVFRALG